MKRFPSDFYIYEHFSKISLIAPLNLYKRKEITSHLGVRMTDYQFKRILEMFFVRESFGYYSFKIDKVLYDVLQKTRSV